MQAMVENAQDKRLRVEVRRDRDAGLIAITDRGQGIAADLLPKIFDLYFTTKTTGSGIGLAMSYRIVQMHGGSMEVVSQPGQGATFTVRVPLRARAPGRSRGSLQGGTPDAFCNFQGHLPGDPGAAALPGRDRLPPSRKTCAAAARAAGYVGAGGSRAGAA